MKKKLLSLLFLFPQDEPVGLSGAGFNNESTAPALDKLQAAGEGGGFIPGLKTFFTYGFFPQGKGTVGRILKDPPFLREIIPLYLLEFLNF